MSNDLLELQKTLDSDPLYKKKVKTPQVETPKVTENDDSFIQNFGEGLEQGGKSLASGGAYAIGELSTYFTSDDSEGERLKQWAQDYQKSAPEADDSWGQFLGSLVPSIIPTAGAIGATMVSGGLAAPAAFAAAGTLGLSSMGSGMAEYDRYKTAKGEESDNIGRLATGVAYGLAEYIPERLGLKALSPNIAGKVLFKGNTELAEKAGQSVIANYMKANPKKAVQLIPRLLKGSAIEGAEESATELLTTLTDTAYKDIEDMPNFGQIVKNIGHAALGGAIMGSGMGVLSYKAQSIEERRRRKERGQVILAEIPDRGVAGEVRGINKDGKYDVLLPDGTVESLPEESFGRTVNLTPEQFDNILKGKQESESAIEQEIFDREQQEAESKLQELGDFTQFAIATEDGPVLRTGLYNNLPVFVTDKRIDPRNANQVYIYDQRNINSQPIAARVGDILDKQDILVDDYIAALQPKPRNVEKPITRGETLMVNGVEFTVTGVNREQRKVQIKNVDGDRELIDYEQAEEFRQGGYDDPSLSDVNNDLSRITEDGIQEPIIAEAKTISIKDQDYQVVNDEVQNSFESIEEAEKVAKEIGKRYPNLQAVVDNRTDSDPYATGNFVIQLKTNGKSGTQETNTSEAKQPEPIEGGSQEPGGGIIESGTNAGEPQRGTMDRGNARGSGEKAPSGDGNAEQNNLQPENVSQQTQEGNRPTAEADTMNDQVDLKSNEESQQSTPTTVNPGDGANDKAQSNNQGAKQETRSKADKIAQNQESKAKSPKKTPDQVEQYEEEVRILSQDYVAERDTPSHLSTVESAIWTYGPFSVTQKSFVNFSDKNNITQSMAKSYIRKDAMNVDQVADEISSSLYGDSGYIEPQDIVDFMVRFPNGVDSSDVKISPTAREIERQYQELTGKRINIRIAKNNTTPLDEPLTAEQEDLLDKVPFQKMDQPDLFGATEQRSPTKRDKLQDDLNRAAKRLRELNNKPKPAKTNLVLEEIEALKKEIVRINSQINNAMMRGEATKGGEQQALFQKVSKLEDGTQTNQSGETADQESAGVSLQSAYNVIKGSARTASSKQQKAELEQQAAKKYAQENSLLIGKLSDLGEPIRGGGVENTLAIQGNELFKANNLFPHNGSLSEYMEVIERHNILFPETAYEFVGFQEIQKDGKPFLKPIVKQTFISDSRQATQQEIDTFMIERGYTKQGSHRWSEGNYTVSDVRPNNVLVREDGTVYVIDNSISEAQEVRFQKPDQPVKTSKTDPSYLKGATRANISSRIFNPFKPPQKPKVEALVNKLIVQKSWKNAPEVVVWESMLDFMVNNPNLAYQITSPDIVTGFWWEEDGKVHIIADHYHFRKGMPSVENTMLHELVGHYGLRGLMEQKAGKNGDYKKELNAILGDVIKTYQDTREMSDLARIYYGSTFSDLTDSQKLEIAEEFIAHRAQTGLDASLQDRIIAWLRKLWEDFTGVRSKMDDLAIRNIIHNSRKYLQVGDNYVNRANARKAYANQVLGEVRNQIITTPQGEVEVGSFQKNGNTYISAFKDGELVGTAMFAEDGEAMAVDVDEDYRRQGIATAMYNTAKNLGVKIKPGQIQTAEGKAFRDNVMFQIIGEGGASRLENAERVLANLSIAKEMEQVGKDPKNIFLATQWEKGVDGKWKVEIPDGEINIEALKELDKNKDLANQEVVFDLVTYKVNPDGTYHVNLRKKGATKTSEFIEYKALPQSDLITVLESEELVNEILENKGQDSIIGENLDDAKEIKREFKTFVTGGEPLSNVYSNKELFKAYPELKNAVVSINSKMNAAGSYSKRDGQFVIELQNVASRGTLPTLTHEIQHAIQDIEGFARGGNVSMFTESQNLFTEAKERLELLIQVDELAKQNKTTPKNFVEKSDYKEWEKEYLENYYDYWDSTLKIARDKILTPEQKYKRLAGEVESRNVESRLGLSPEDRKAKMLSETEDIDRDQQIVLSDAMNEESKPLFQIVPPTDSQAFKKWFGDSKVVDEKGEPLVVYHSSFQNFDEFKKNELSTGDGFFFTEKETDLKYYDKSSRKNIYPVFLAIKNPKNIVVDSNAWSSQNFEQPKIKEAQESGHDGVVFIHNLNPERKYFVAFSPTQIKSATGNNGNFDQNNPDIRFQLQKPVEETKDLIALHNISTPGLLNAEKIGGLPMPSLAITKSDLQFTSFGDISLIADKSMIDPKVRGNRTFGADVYSPRYPSVTYFADLKQVKEKFGQASDQMPTDWKSDTSKLVDDIRDKGIEGVKHNALVKTAYLLSQGKKLPTLKEEPKPWILPELKKHVEQKKAQGFYDILDVRKDEKFQELYLKHREEELRRAGLTDDDRAMVRLSKIDLKEGWQLDTALIEVNKALNPKKVYKTSEWFNEIDSRIGNYRDSKYKKYEAWVEEQFADINIDEKLFKDFSYDGSRKIYVDHNIENVMKILKKDIRGGEGGSYGVGMARAAYTPQFKSIADIRKNKDNIVDPKTFEKIKEEVNDEFSKLADMYPKSGRDFGHRDRVINFLVDAGKNGMRREMKAYGFDLSESTIEATQEFIDKLRNFPTEYFESKPNRVVDLSEFKGAVVPKGTKKEIIDSLKAKGMTVKTYDSNSEEDRWNKVNQVASRQDVMFQKSSPFTFREQPNNVNDNFYSNSLHALRNITQGKATPEQWKAMLLKNGGSQAELDWIGFDEQFSDRKSVPRDEVMDFISSNQIEVVDVVKGTFNPRAVNESDVKSVRFKDFGSGSYMVEFGNEIGDIEISTNEAQDENEAIKVAIERANYDSTEYELAKPKYSQYQLPGGENYKEVLLTMPAKSTGGLTNSEQQEFDNLQYLIDSARNPDNALTKKEENRHQELLKKRIADRKKDYKSSHWDEPNILAHIRFNEREVNGERVLFLEEIQSDWAQEGRKKGFKMTDNQLYSDLFTFQDDLAKKYSFRVSENTGRVFVKKDQLDKAELLKLETLEKEAEEKSKGSIPNMPFPQTSQWVNLSLRRMIRYASENGFDRIAWVNGEQSADRYDLSKQVDELYWNPNTEILYAYKNKAKIIEKEVPKEQLPDVIGKETADKLLSSPKKGNQYELKGEQLKIGGEGMKDFYNKIIPSQVKKVLAKVDKSVKVEEIGLTGTEVFDVDNTSVKERAMSWLLFNQENEQVAAISKEATEGLPGKQIHFELIDLANEYAKAKKGSQQLSFPITSKISQIARQEGMPLFQRHPTVEATKEQMSAFYLNSLRNFQDRMIDVRLLQQEKTIYDDTMNPYVYDNLSVGIINEETRRFREEQEKPLVDTIKKITDTGKTYEEVSRYLKAKHIVDDKVEKGGIPMDEAMTIVEAFERTVSPATVNELQKKVQTVVRWTNEHNLKMGLITPKKFESNAKYNFYVPLRGFTGREDTTTLSKNFKRKGRESESGDPIAHMMSMGESAILMGQQNKVKQHLLNFVEANPDPTLYRIKNAWYLKRLNDDGTETWVETSDKPGPAYNEEGMVKRDVDPEVDSVEYLEERILPIDISRLSVMVDGRKIVLEFIGEKGKRITDAFGRQQIDKVPKVFKWLGNYSRFLTNFYTKYSPEFAFRNFIRDMTTGMINLQTDHGSKTSREVIGSIPSSLKTLRKWITTGQFNDPLLQEFVENGALTGYSDLKTISERQAELESTIKGLQGNKVQWTKDMFTNKLLKPIDDINRMFENGIRFSAYKSLRNKGLSPQKAAIYAKDLTVNFNRKGNWSSNLGALYLFFNASVQGTERLLRPFGASLYKIDAKTRNRAIKTAIALPMFSFALGMINRAMGGKDEDDEYYYDKLPDYTRQHNILIPNLFTGKDGDFIQIPLPYGYNVMFASSDHLGRALLGKETAGHAALNTMSVMMESFSPIGGVDLAQKGMKWHEGVLRMAIPTALDPVMDLAMNKNFAGMPIYREGYPGQTPEPESQRYFSNVNPVLKEITSQINRLTGGSEFESGAIDVNPEEVEHYLNTIFGGVGSFLNNSWTTAANLLSGDNPVSFDGDKIKKVPFVRNYVTYPSDYVNQGRFYENANEVKTTDDIFDRYRKSGNKSQAMAFRKENINTFKLVNLTKSTADRAKEIKDRIRTLKMIPGMEDQVKRLEKELNNLYLTYNKKFDQVTKGEKEPLLAELLGL